MLYRRKPSWINYLKIKFEKYVQLKTNWKIQKDFKYLNSFDFRQFDNGREVSANFGIFRFFDLIYPELRLHSKYRERVSPNYWNNKINQNQYFVSISQRIPHPVFIFSDWKYLDSQCLRSLDGESLYQKDPSILNLLENNFPGFFWERIWRYPHITNDHYKKRVFIDAFILAHLDVSQQSGLTTITKELFSQFPNGGSILTLYQGSPQSLFHRTYPELIPEFRTFRGYWQTAPDNQLIGRTMLYYNIKEKCDWYRLSNVQFSKMFGKAVKKKNLIKMLRFFLPEEEWEESRFSESNKRSRQNYLRLKLMEMFHGETIFEEYVIKSKENKTSYFFDFYLPTREVVVEYQGEQHYYNVANWRSSEVQKKRDTEKVQFCVQLGLKVIVVPFWWDGTVSSLKQIFNI